MQIRNSSIIDNSYFLKITMYKLFVLTLVSFLISCGNYQNTKINYNKGNKIADIAGYKIHDVTRLDTKIKKVVTLKILSYIAYLLLGCVLP